MIRERIDKSCFAHSPGKGARRQARDAEAQASSTHERAQPSLASSSKEAHQLPHCYVCEEESLNEVEHRRHKELLRLRDEVAFLQLAAIDPEAAEWQRRRKREVYSELKSKGLIGPFPPEKNVANEVRRRHHIIMCLKNALQREVEYRHVAESLLADVQRQYANVV